MQSLVSRAAGQPARPHSVFPETGVAYTADDPRAELSQEELRSLLVEVSGAFSG